MPTYTTFVPDMSVPGVTISESLRELINDRMMKTIALDLDCSLNLHVCDSDDFMIEKLPDLLKEIDGPFQVACPTAKIRHKLAFKLDIPIDNMFLLQTDTYIKDYSPPVPGSTLIVWDYLSLDPIVKGVIHKDWKRVDLIIKLLRMINDNGTANTELSTLVI